MNSGEDIASKKRFDAILSDLKDSKPTLSPTETIVKTAGDFFVVDTAVDDELCYVTPTVAVGSQSAATNLDALVDVDVVLNVSSHPATEALINEYERLHIEYIHVPVLDLPSEDEKKILSAAAGLAAALADESTVALVHCNAGVSRSCAVVVLHLMRTERLSYDDAMAKVRQARPVARPNSGFEALCRRLCPTL